MICNRDTWNLDLENASDNEVARNNTDDLIIADEVEISKWISNCANE